jgi:hypothetical protein
MWRGLLVLSCFLAALSCEAQQHTFTDVKARFSRAKDRLLVEKDAQVIFDEASRKLIVRSSDRPLQASYDAVRKISLELSIRGTDPGLAIAFGGLVGAAIHDDTRAAFWCYVEIDSGGAHLLLIGKDDAQRFREKARATFGERFIEVKFIEVAQKIEKQALPEAEVKYDVRADPQQHPEPELKPDQALVVVACPPINTRYAGKGNAKLHVDGKVIAANEMGTYTFFYLSPGEHTLVSQMGNASSLRLNFEAGKDYYFLQSTSIGWTSPQSLLSRQSKELVMYEVAGSRWATWKVK